MIDPTIVSALIDALPEPYRPYVLQEDVEYVLDMGVGVDHVGAYLNSQALKRRNAERQGHGQHLMAAAVPLCPT